MHPARPQVTEVPCPVCGKPVDPLRARRVILLEDGFRYLCDAGCVERFRQGDRVQEGPARRTPRSSARVTPPKGWPGAVRPPRTPRASASASASASSSGSLSTSALSGSASASSSASSSGSPLSVRPPAMPLGDRTTFRDLEPWQWAGITAVGGALVVGFIPGPMLLAMVSALLTCTAVGVSVYAGAPVRRDVGLVPYLFGPAGAVLASVSGLVARASDPSATGLLVGAAVAAGAVLARIWIDRDSVYPLAQAVERLREPLPTTVRVPVEDASNPLEMRAEPVQTDAVRTGEQVLAFKGEVVAVDGVVQAGDATAYLHPAAHAPVRRRPGDPVLAGARIVEGAVRLLVTRVGEDRGMVRPGRFGRGAGPNREAAPIGWLADRMVRWGTVAAAAAALAGLAFVEGQGLAGQLSAAAAVLLVAPLITLRRSAETPWIAAGAAAAERGIVYASARAIDAAGRVTVAALCTHGTITEGAPDVVEVYPVDPDSDLDEVLALVAGAELVAEGQPIARAIRRYAEHRGVEAVPVRRPTIRRGRGVTAVGPDGEAIVIGNRQLLLDEGISVALADDDAVRAEERGHTVLFAAVGERVRAIFALQDDIRPGARAAVQRLFDLQVEVVLVSGDHRTTVETLASNLGVAHVRAELPPDERTAEVRKLREHGGPVAAVGHKTRDEEALSGADVPVVLEGAGAPAAARGVGLASGDVRDAAAALWIARAARTEAWRATLAAAAGGTALVAAAAAGWLAPGIAAVLAVGLDAWSLPAGSRLLRRIALRIPTRA